jgi:arginine/lysine/ornithine decarboxylase
MPSIRKHISVLAGLGLVASMWMVLAGCASQGRRSHDGMPADAVAAKLRDCERLKKELESRNEVILKLTADLEHLGDVLEYAERQFISLERDLQNNETKASAVAALAEAKLSYDASIRDNPEAAELPAIRQAHAKIEASDKLLSQERYDGSVYFAKKALRLIEDRHMKRNVHIVAVDNANLRSGPGTEYAVLTRVALGAVLFQVGSQSAWYKVETLDGKAGWVHRSITSH